MEFTDILNRRTRKDFDSDHQISDEELYKIIDAARLTPSSFNIQPWRFVAIRDRGLKEKIKRVAGDQPQIAVNSVLIAVCADLNAWNDNPGKYWAANGKDFANYMSELTRNFYNNNSQLQRDEAQRSVGMCAMTIMFAATDLGYACNPIVGYEHDAVASIINLPKNHLIGMLIAIGLSTSEPIPKTVLPRNETLIYDFFPSD